MAGWFQWISITDVIDYITINTTGNSYRLWRYGWSGLMGYGAGSARGHPGGASSGPLGQKGMIAEEDIRVSVVFPIGTYDIRLCNYFNSPGNGTLLW